MNKIARRIKRVRAASEKFCRWRRQVVNSKHWYRCLARVARKSSGLRRKESSHLINEVLCKEMARDLGVEAQRLRSEQDASMPPSQRAVAYLWHRLQSITTSDNTPSSVDGNDSRSAIKFPSESLHQAKLKSLRQLAYGASHELNNPLANIVVRAQTLLRGETCNERRKKLQTIEHQALRAHEMISDLMLFAHPPTPRFDTVDLSDLVRGVLVEMERFLSARRIDVRLIVNGQFGDWHVDVTQLAECLRALIKNATESIGEAGQITIHLSRDDHIARLSVCDSGQGIDPQAVEHIFDPFFSGREAGRGLGFGLSKAWRITEMHQGNLTCTDPTPGQTTFEIQLPQVPTVARAA